MHNVAWTGGVYEESILEHIWSVWIASVRYPTLSNEDVSIAEVQVQALL